MIILFAVIISLMCMAITAGIAEEKGYDKSLGFLAGATWIGIIVFLLLPKKEVKTVVTESTPDRPGDTVQTIHTEKVPPVSARKKCFNCKKTIMLEDTVCPYCGKHF